MQVYAKSKSRDAEKLLNDMTSEAISKKKGNYDQLKDLFYSSIDEISKGNTKDIAKFKNVIAPLFLAAKKKIENDYVSKISNIGDIDVNQIFHKANEYGQEIDNNIGEKITNIRKGLDETIPKIARSAGKIIDTTQKVAGAGLGLVPGLAYGLTNSAIMGINDGLNNKPIDPLVGPAISSVGLKNNYQPSINGSDIEKGYIDGMSLGAGVGSFNPVGAGLNVLGYGLGNSINGYQQLGGLAKGLIL